MTEDIELEAERDEYWQSRSRTRVQQELVCPICIETFTEPRTLTCQHTFCTACLQQLVDASRRTRMPGKLPQSGSSPPRNCGAHGTAAEIVISCPECRANISLPNGGVRSLPKNFKLERIIEILSPLEREELVKESAHKQPSNYCHNHTKKVTEYFCITCNTPACGDCLLEQHLNHNVKRMSEILAQCSQALKELIPDANEALKSGKASLNAMQKQSDSLVQQGTEISQGIDAYFRKLRDLLKKREEELKQEVAEQVETKCLQIERNSFALENSMDDIQEFIQNVEKVTQNESLELLLKEKRLKSEFKLSQRDLESFCSTASKLQKLSIKEIPLEDTRLEVLCRTLASKAPMPLPRKRQEPPPSSTETQPHLLRADSEAHDYALTPNVRRLDEVQYDRHTSIESDTPLLAPPAPMRKESFQFTPVIVEPESIWGPQQLSSAFFQYALGSVYPRGVCSGVAGTTIVTDIQNHCIRILASTGRCLDVIGRDGKNDGQFGEPTAITADLDGNLLVCDLCPARLQKFSPEGKFITKISRIFHTNPLGEPWGIAVNHEGKIFVSDWDRSCIHMYNEKGRYAGNFGSTGNDTHLKYPAGIAIDKRGRIIVADRGNHVVCIYSPDGNLLSRFGKTGHAPGELHFPFGVAVNKDSSNILISESGNHRISVFDARGNFLRCFGAKGSAPGHFHLPRHICFDKEGRLIVADEQNQRIQTFSSY